MNQVQSDALGLFSLGFTFRSSVRAEQFKI